MKCIAIDDEPVALSVISQFCKRTGNMELSVYSDPVIGISRVIETIPDIVFLDIEMNGISGIELAKSLPKGTCLIFTTAYVEFALDGFELDAIDYLHKPFSYSRFEKAVQKAKDLLQMRNLAQKSTLSDVEIIVKVEYQNVRIAVPDIQYIEAMDNYVKIYTMDARPVVSQMNLKKILRLLPEEEFVRVHKSYIVPIRKIAGFTKKYLMLTYKSIEIPIGRSYADDFMKLMKSNDPV